MLKDLLARFRSDPAIKKALGRGEQPPMRDLYAALRRFLADPEFASYVEARQISTRAIDDPFEEKTHTLYLPNRTEESNRYRDLAKQISQEMSASARGKLSAYTRNQLVDWCNSNRGGRSISADALREIQCLEGVRPEGPLTVYRGLLFQKTQLEPPRFELDRPRNALIFLDAMRHGHRDIVLDSARLSSWTTSPETANRFAQHRAAANSYTATIQALRMGNSFIDGDLGIVLKATLDPEQILCDVRKVEVGHHLNHGDEGEIIVMPGNLRVHMEHIYTRKGEVTPKQFVQSLDQAA